MSVTVGTVTLHQRTATGTLLADSFPAVIDNGVSAVLVLFTDVDPLFAGATVVCTVGGVTASFVVGSSNTNGIDMIYGLLAPPTGSAVTVTMTDTNPSAPTYLGYGAIAVVPLFGTDTSTPWEVYNYKLDGNPSQTITLTTTNDNDLFVIAAMNRYAPSLSVSGTNTLTSLYAYSSSGTYFHLGYSMPTTTAGAYSVTATGPYNATALGMVAVKPASGGPSAPAAPGGVSATAGNTQNTITWSASSGATSYNLYWSTTTGVTTSNGTQITGVTSPYTHTSLTNGTAYYYIVTAVNATGESVASSQVTATPAASVTSHFLGLCGCGT